MKPFTSKSASRGVPLGTVVIVLAVGVMVGGAMMAAFVMSQGPAAPAASTTREPRAAQPAAEPVTPSAAVTAFTAPIVSVGDGTLVVALPDMPHKGKAVPTVTVRLTASTAFSGRVPKSPQEIDQAAGAAAARPDAVKGLPPPPERAEGDLYKDVPMTATSFLKDDVVRIETADEVGGKEITATSVALIFRPEAPAAGSGAAPSGGSQPAPASIRPTPVK